MITVLLVDDHPLVREGLRAVIEAVSDLNVVGEARDGDEVVEAAGRSRPDVVLMDLSMARVDGVSAIGALRDAGCSARVVVLSSFGEDSQVRAALAAGAVGYLLKDSEPARIIEAIQAAAAGHAPLDPRVAGALLPQPTPVPGSRVNRPSRAVHRQPVDGELDALSPREQEVLALVVQGKANKQIASALGITERTVKAHLGAIFRTIDVTERTSAALWARDRGLG